jgi:hypothetical protein
MADLMTPKVIFWLGLPMAVLRRNDVVYVRRSTQT